MYRKDFVKQNYTSCGQTIRLETTREDGRTLECRVLPTVVTDGRCLCPFEFQLMACRGHFGTRDISRRIVPLPDRNGDRSQTV